MGGTRTGREIELKLEVPTEQLTALLRSPKLRELTTEAPRRQTLRSVYYDTRDLALWRSGLVLRVRAAGRRRIVGVKTRGVTRGGLVDRDELEGPLAGSAPDPGRVAPARLLASIGAVGLRRRVARAAAGQPLLPRVETRFRRSTLRPRLGTAVVELALDVGEVRAGRSRLPIREVELELVSGPIRALFDLALRLADEAELRPFPLGKAERGFARLLGEEAAPVRARRVRLERGASLDATIRAVLSECMRHLAANQPSAERGRDPEGIHQMRVGARRLRSALELFDAWLQPRVAGSLSAELRWLAGELGRARDLDVFIEETLGPTLARRPEDAGLLALRRAARAARSDAGAQVRSGLRSRRYALLVLRLGRFIEGASLRRAGVGPLEVPALPEARRLLRQRARRVRQLGSRLERLSARDRHRLRIRAKRLRYAIELLAPLFPGKAPARMARRLAELQDALGRLNDLVSVEMLLEGLRERTGAGIRPVAARAEGFVLGYAAHSAATGRAELARAWRRVARSAPFWKGRS
jgi:inorganic triphosphatase YgiF